MFNLAFWDGPFLGYVPIFTVVFLTSCGTSKHVASSSMPPEHPFSLLGVNDSVFATSCVLSSDNQSLSQLETIVFQDNQFTRTFSSFDGADCKSEKLRYLIVDNLIDVRKLKRVDFPGWNSYSYRYDQVDALPESATTITEWNKTNAFDYSDWAIHESKNVSGRKFNKTSSAKNSRGDLGQRTLKFDHDQLLIARQKEDGLLTQENPKVFYLVK